MPRLQQLAEAEQGADWRHAEEMHPRWAHSILDKSKGSARNRSELLEIVRVGNTPVVRLRRRDPHPRHLTVSDPTGNCVRNGSFIDRCAQFKRQQHFVGWRRWMVADLKGERWLGSGARVPLPGFPVAVVLKDFDGTSLAGDPAA